MTVKELMEQLEQQDQDSEVVILLESNTFKDDIKLEIRGLVLDEDDDNVYIATDTYYDEIF